MTGLLRKALLVAAIAAVVAAPAAKAGVPDPTKCTFTSTCIMMLPGLNDAFVLAPAPPLVASNGVTITVHDATDAAVSGINVYIDISATSDLRFANVQEAGTVVDCANKRIYRVTNASGQVTFRLRGSGKNSQLLGGIGPGGNNQTKVIAGSTQIKTINIAVPDQNGGGTLGTIAPGIEAGDGSFTRYDILNFFGAGQASRSDYNCSTAPDAADGSILRGYILNDSGSGVGSITGPDFCVPA